MKNSDVPESDWHHLYLHPFMTLTFYHQPPLFLVYVTIPLISLTYHLSSHSLQLLISLTRHLSFRHLPPLLSSHFSPFLLLSSPNFPPTQPSLPSHLLPSISAFSPSSYPDKFPSLSPSLSSSPCLRSLPSSS